MTAVTIILLVVLIVMVWRQLHKVTRQLIDARALVVRLQTYIAASRRVPEPPADLPGVDVPAEVAAAVLVGTSPEAE